MAINTLWPGFMKLYYTSNGHQHIQVLPMTQPVGTPSPGILPDFETADALPTTHSFDIIVDEYVDAILPLFNTTTNFSMAEYWWYPTTDSDPIFIYAYEVGVAGISATATFPYSQAVMTLRTKLGGLLKLYFMEVAVSSVNVRDPFPFAGVIYPAIYTHLTTPGASGRCIVGRDGGYVVSGINVNTKTNDALRKKYLLNS